MTDFAIPLKPRYACLRFVSCACDRLAFGVIGSALSWIQLYLSDRTQCFTAGRSTREGKFRTFRCATMISSWAISTVNILKFTTNDQDVCLADINGWMSSNVLMSNEEKSELIISKLKHQFGNKAVHVTCFIKHLGVYFET